MGHLSDGEEKVQIISLVSMLFFFGKVAEHSFGSLWVKSFAKS